MPSLATVADDALATLDRVPRSDHGARLRALRRAAAARVHAQGLPTIALEDWKYTGLSSLEQSAMRAATSADSVSVSLADLRALELSTTNALRVVLEEAVHRGVGRGHSRAPRRRVHEAEGAVHVHDDRQIGVVRRREDRLHVRRPDRHVDEREVEGGDARLPRGTRDLSH